MRQFIALTAVATWLALIPLALAAPGKSSSAPGQIKKVIVGAVQSVSSDTVTVQDEVSRISTQVHVDAAFNLKSIKVNDKIAVISTAKSATSGGQVQKIFVKSATASAQLKRQAVMGVISAINGNVLTLTHQIHTDRTYTVVVTPTTIITSPLSPSPTAATSSGNLSQLTVGLRIVAVGHPGADGLVAKLIHIIPGKAIGVYKKLPPVSPSPVTTASPSALPSPTTSPSASASPSATPGVSPSPTPI